ncbi:Dolichyldiphosphatase 1, partial [Stegodyphus mimosarum]
MFWNIVDHSKPVLYGWGYPLVGIFKARSNVGSNAFHHRSGVDKHHCVMHDFPVCKYLLLVLLMSAKRPPDKVITSWYSPTEDKEIDSETESINSTVSNISYSKLDINNLDHCKMIKQLLKASSISICKSIKIKTTSAFHEVVNKHKSIFSCLTEKLSKNQELKENKENNMDITIDEENPQTSNNSKNNNDDEWTIPTKTCKQPKISITNDNITCENRFEKLYQKKKITLALESLTPVQAFSVEVAKITFLCGTALNEAINWILKHLIKELRPCRGREILYSEYGMPSNHAQFMWFFATYMAFFLLIRLHHGNSTYPLENAWKYIVTVFIICVAAIVSYSRIYLQYHTWTQVLCGACLGIFLACIWFAITQFTLTPLFPIIAAWPISEFLMLRDTTLIPNVMWFEYTSHRTESRQPIEARVCRIPIYYKNHGSELLNSMDTLVAVTDKPNVRHLITPEIHELLLNPDGEESNIQRNNSE